MIGLDALTGPFKELVDEIKKDAVLGNNLMSLIVFGSFVRGDFIENQSDLDIYAVYKKMSKETISQLAGLIEEYIKIKYRVLDFSCSNLEEISDPLTKGYPFKHLIADQEDFRQHHLVLYGDEITDQMPVYTWNETKYWRAKRLIGNIERFKDRPDLLRISAGQTILFMTREAGATGIGKAETLRAIKQIGDEQAIEIFTAYIEGIELDYPHEYWVDFIKTRLKSYVS